MPHKLVRWNDKTPLWLEGGLKEEMRQSERAGDERKRATERERERWGKRDWDQCDCLTRAWCIRGHLCAYVWALCVRSHTLSSISVLVFFYWKHTKENASNMNNECDILKWKPNQVGSEPEVKPENNGKPKVVKDKRSNAYKYKHKYEYEYEYKYHIMFESNELYMLCLLLRISQYNFICKRKIFHKFISTNKCNKCVLKMIIFFFFGF